MKTLPEKLLEMIETCVSRTSHRVEVVIVGKSTGPQEQKIMLAVQRAETFQTLFNISITIEPRLASITMTPLKECVDPDEHVTELQNQVDTITIDFKTGGGVKHLTAALDVRLRRGDITDTVFAPKHSRLDAGDAGSLVDNPFGYEG